MNIAIQDIIEENNRRNAEVYARFSPVVGYGSVGERVKVFIKDFPIPTQYIPVEMMNIPFIKQLLEAGSLENFLDGLGTNDEDYESDRLKVILQFVRLRSRYDFPFWAAMFV